MDRRAKMGEVILSRALSKPGTTHVVRKSGPSAYRWTAGSRACAGGCAWRAAGFLKIILTKRCLQRCSWGKTKAMVNVSTSTVGDVTPTYIPDTPYGLVAIVHDATM